MNPIKAGNILVVDRSASVANGILVVVIVHEEMVVCQIVRSKDRLEVRCEDQDVDLAEDPSFEIWGKVTYILHPIRDMQ